MVDSKIWMVDRAGAANLGMALGLDLSEAQLAVAAEHLAGHRATALEMAVSRMRSSILDRIHKVRLAAYNRRGAEWVEGCSAAEHAILAMTSAELLEILPSQETTQGQVLRTMIRHARKNFAANTRGPVHG